MSSPSILGIDPGKKGYFALLSADGARYRFWPMPLIGDKIVASAIASVYLEIKALCKSPPAIYIERAFSKPTDTCSQSDYDAARGYLNTIRYCKETSKRDVNEISISANIPIPFLPEVRMDGRVGNFRYAEGYGYLHMPALWSWPITTVSPKTWMNAMYKGLPGDLDSKDRARYYIQQKWPELMRKGSVIWPERAKKALDGACDALVIADYGRLHA